MPPLKRNNPTKFKNIIFSAGLVSSAKQVQNGKQPSTAALQKAYQGNKGLISACNYHGATF